MPGDGVEEAAKALQVYHLTNTSAEGNAEMKRQLVTTFEQEHDYSLSPFTAEVLTVHEQWQKQQIEENLNPALVAEVVAEAIGEFKQGADLNTQAGLVDEVLNGANESPHAYVVREEILSALEYQQFLVENDTPAITDGIQAHKQEPGRYYLYHFVEHSNVRVLDIKYTGYVPVLESASGIDYLIYMR